MPNIPTFDDKLLRVLPLTGLLLTATLVGCASSPDDNPFQEPTQGQDRIMLRVENQNLSDARVYMYPRGRRTLLGEIRTRGLEIFEFGWDPGMPLDLEIDLMAGGRYRLPRSGIARPGQVELIIASSLRRSVIRY
jgi:hypothetical protein